MQGKVSKKKKAQPPSVDEQRRQGARLFAKLGGRARMKQLTPEERSALGKKAGQASGVVRRKKAQG